MKKSLLSIVLLFLPLAGWAQDFAVSANLLELADFGTLNVEGSYAPARHWSLSASARYNPFAFGEGEQEILQRQQTYSAGARYWPWHIFAGWWMSAKMQYQEFCNGGIRSRRTSQGDRLGFGLGAGYTYMLSKHFNLEMGLGIWGGNERFTTYSCQRCGVIVDEGEKVFLLPNDMMLSLTYIF